MSILASLARAYERLPDAPPFGYSMQNIGIVVSLNADGSVASVTDWRTGEGKKKRPRPMLVPQPVKRTAGITPNFLWDKTSYVLGVTAGAGKRTADEHAAFIARHEDMLGDTEDAGLQALLLFLRQWTPDQFAEPLWQEDLKDQNIIFALESDRRQNIYVHNRPAAKALWSRIAAETASEPQICLVTGNSAPVARLHPSIKGVWGAQTAGAALSSFNLDAFTSYGHEQGDNAPVSEAAAFAYTTALNRFLERDSSHRVQIGDASTVFWADAEDAAAAAIAENMCSIMFNGDEVGADEDSGDSDEDARAEETALNTASTKDVLAKLDRIRKGEPLAQVEPKLAHGVRFHVLGLAPNAARLSVRFYFEDDFGVLAENYRNYCQDMAVDPPDRSPNPPLWRYLLELAVQRKRENVPPKIAGDWMRAILGGTQYPHTLLTSALMRIRSDGTVNALRVSMLKAVLIRNYNMEAPVSLDPDNRNKGYILGRLFAVYEETQRAALGNNVNATIKDKFYSSASATPRKVFAMLNSGSANHLSKVAKTNRGRSVNLGKLLDDIMAVMSPADDPFPASFSAQEQAMFGLGYHHQHAEFFKSKNANHAEDEANSDDNA